MIQKLETTVDYTNCVVIPPDSFALTAKINEIIDYLNGMESRQKALDERSLRLGMEAQRKLDENMPQDPTKPKRP